MEVTCNEPIDKAMPPEVVAAMLQLLKNYGVPVHHRLSWIYSQKGLYRQLKAYYDQQKKEEADR